jgi:predicted metalloprotease
MTSLEKQKLNVPRAAIQFQVSLPMRFRIRGERAWHDAWADSMSAAEIIFRGDEVMEIGETLDIRLGLPQPGIGRHGGTIVSKAKVTQSWRLSEKPEQAFIAAALSGPRLIRFGLDNGSDEPDFGVGKNRK